jgi:Uma2 family endonuclease
MYSAHLTLPEQALPARLAVNPDMQMSDDEFHALCLANPDLRFERTSQGEIVIVPPAGIESDHQSVDVIAELRAWAKRDGRGKSFGSSAGFSLPTRALLSPDAAWVSNEKLGTLSRKQIRQFPPLSPEFIVEVMSPTDRIKDAREKMKEWMRAGVELAWLIQPDERTLYIYRPSDPEPEIRTGISSIAGEGPVQGFELDLTDIWAGL